MSYVTMQTRQKEEWKDIKGFEGLYQISNFGKVKRMRYINKNTNKEQERIKVLKLRKDGYYEVALYKDGKPKYIQVHRLVAGAFLQNPNNLPQVNHKDGNKQNNYVENLEWVTISENVLHSTRVLRKNIREVSQYTLSGIYLATYSSIQIASEITGIRQSSISNVLAKRRHKAGGYSWRYERVDNLKNMIEENMNHIPRID